MDASSRRFDLLALVLNIESLRGGGRRTITTRLMVCLCQGECDHLNRHVHADIDRAWLMGELAKVKVEPGEYSDDVYERWRLFGLPAWAALAAGMTPTPGSRKLIGRRPNLP